MEYIKIKMQLSIYQSPPLEAQIEQESERLKRVYKLCLLVVFVFYALLAAICAAVSMLNPEYLIIPAMIASCLIASCLSMFIGVFATLNGKDALSYELKKLKPISAANFPDEYYKLSQLSQKNDEIKAYLISVSKLGRAPIYLEFLMLKDWFEGIPARERLNAAESVFSDIASQADATFRDVAGGCEVRTTLLRWK